MNREDLFAQAAVAALGGLLASGEECPSERKAAAGWACDYAEALVEEVEKRIKAGREGTANG